MGLLRIVSSNMGKVIFRSVLVCFLFTTTTCCPFNWVDGSTVDMGCIYLNNRFAFNWEEAYGYCNNEDSSLIEIRTEEQMIFLTDRLYELEQYYDKTSWWIGASDLGREGRWIWMDSLSPVESFVWHKAYPNGGVTENCLYLNSGGKYEGYDNPCSVRYFPICQKHI